jgi:hypothetical protein
MIESTELAIDDIAFESLIKDDYAKPQTCKLPLTA